MEAEGPVIIANAAIVDGTSADRQEDRHVLIRHGLIEAVSDRRGAFSGQGRGVLCPDPDAPSFGVSVLIVEQRARQALAISDYGYIMDGGKVALEGPPDGLLADERAAELYLGRRRSQPPTLEHAISTESPT